MTQQQILKTRAGDVIMDGRKTAFLPDSKTLLVADMHFEKGSYLRQVGRSALPAFDTFDTIERLWAIAQDYNPERIIALGDSFHDIEADTRLSPQSAARLNELAATHCEIIWVLGNHDPDIPRAVKGAREDHVQLGGFLLTHHPYEPQEGVNICGHYHPKAKISMRAGSVTAPCFAISNDRIIMPSFGTYTGGLFINHPDFTKAIPGLSSYAMAYKDQIFGISVDS
ncbi:ligase-associated DNA damage response endonuclease PdeM [Hellea sp.]|nr:ligase-associated DNA damage response endonuclease PdeM [Hellea sp.]